MVTKVGLQARFSEATKNLLELEYDAVEACEAAISRLREPKFRQKIIEFEQDHWRQIQAISELLDEYDRDFHSGISLKAWIAKSKVIIADWVGDSSILAAIRSNEDDIYTAYENLEGRDDAWEDARSILSRGLAYEREHCDWLGRV